ncbi:hypothetical protein THAOC_09258 [Thalassiosira oceanica]|uniref:RING-type domain-containing protein n=1 Tax=Thalassiosira oceanica TaxID=159749 RepID=K0T7Z3_THAOC|nr:hypothetical protein THAOC_09258 [Thalassiosira oceanica]|eukprot:EJK69481.1 hypothetical protein THAOC_09258 [Thalassiosira oceanica]
MRGVLDELRAGEEADAGCCPAAADGGPGSDSPLAAAAADRMRRISSYADISEIGDDPADSCRDDPGCDAVVTPPGGAPRHRPALFRSGSLLPSPAPGPMDAIRESSSSCGRGGDVAGASALPSEGYWSSSTNNPNRCLICLSEERTATIVHGETGHIACCLTCARILKARGDACPVCRLPIDLVVQQFWA